MPKRPFLSFLAVLPLLSACTVLSPDRDAASLRARTEPAKILHLPLSPSHACQRIARMLSWCANGPNFHYRCHIARDDNSAELTGTLELIFRTEVFMVTDLTRDGKGSIATLRQRQGYLIDDYAPLIERAMAGETCQDK